MPIAILAAAAATLAPIPATEPPRAILTEAVEAMGGAHWLTPTSLVLEGNATFYSPDSAVPKSVADDYRMWRDINPARTVSHGADGKVRILARTHGATMFTVGFDGTTTWTDKGVMPKPAADAYWAANFGFGIIRQALGPDFTLERVPDRMIDGHSVALIRILGPDGGRTLFGIDRATRFVRYMAFASPRGFHERSYDDFLVAPGWVQARKVTLTYDGVVQNVVRWTKVTVDAPIDPAIFAPPR